MKTKFSGILTLLLAFVVHISYAQVKTVSGTVSDKSGPLPGVSIVIKGTNKGTESDFNGNYTIKAKSGDVLVFSFLSMKTVEKTVGASNTINVTMEEDANVLDEVVVTGYSSQLKAEFVGSAVQLSSEKVSDVVNPAVDQALQGKVAGLVVSQNSGTPGSTASIRIRGISSINAGNEPLYVIDGVPITNGNVSSSTSSSFVSSLAAINSNNIKSITVLKDASATSLYGARGANGVIVITTKSGKAGKTNFQINSYYGVQNDAVTGPVPLTGAERFELAAEALFNDFPNVAPTVQAAKNWLLANDAATRAWDAVGRPEGNWSKVIANDNAPIQEYNFSASGGGDGHTFYANLGYYKQEGTVIGSSFERISGAINFSKELTKKVRFSTNNTASHSYQDAFLERSAFFEGARTVKYFISPYVQPYNADGSIAQFGGSLPNPLIISRDNINDNRFTRIITNNTLTWDILENLQFQTRLGIDYRIFHSRTYGNRNYGYSAPNNGEATQSHRNSVTYTIQNSLDYNFQINDDNKFNAKVIQEYQTNRSYFLTASGNQFADDGLVNLNSAGNPVSIGSSFFDWKIGRYLGLVHYSGYDSKYFADVSYTIEGSSRFAPANRWGHFWSVGGGWNMHKEDFLKDVSFLDELKLRASYGTTGNANIGNFDFITGFSFNSNYNGLGAQTTATVGNADLSWESNNSLDVGFDFGLFNRVFTGGFTYFSRKTNDLLYNVPLPQSTGATTIRRNIGSISNKGFEFEFNVNVINTEDMNFTIGGNIATVENNVESLAKDPAGNDITITGGRTRIESGHPINGWYMRTWAGVNPQTGLEEWYVNGVDGATTTNFNSAAVVWQGKSALPTFTSGINLHFDYKGFFLDANAYYAGGHKIYEGWHRYLNETNGFPIRFFNGFNTLLDRWQKPGDVARFGKVTRSTNPWRLHSKFLHDGDFARLRSVTFGYDLPSDVAEKVGMSGLRLYVRGNNLYTWQKAKNNPYDPEVDLGGITGLETPPIKSVLIGVNLKF